MKTIRARLCSAAANSFWRDAQKARSSSARADATGACAEMAVNVRPAAENSVRSRRGLTAFAAAVLARTSRPL
eukprot:834767-Pyramimonas_sp.AAC.1